MNSADTSDAFALAARLDAANQEIARLTGKVDTQQRLHHELWREHERLKLDRADLQSRYVVRKSEGARVERAFAKLYFAATLADTMPGDLDEARKRAATALNRRAVEHHSALRRLFLKRADVVVLKLLTRIDTAHTGNSADPAARVRTARQRLERVAVLRGGAVGRIGGAGVAT
jgi:hypothetical protein